MAIYPQLIIDALKNVRYPGTGQDIVSAGMVEDDIRIDGMKVSFSLITERQNDPFVKSLVKMAEQAILTYADPKIQIKGNISVKSKQAPRPALPDPPDALLHAGARAGAGAVCHPAGGGGGEHRVLAAGAGIAHG